MVHRVAVVMPSLNYQQSLERALSEIPSDRGYLVYVIDDGSDVPLTAPDGVRVIRHPQNRGYGAAQKTGYAAALADGADRVVLLHGDGQYPTQETLALADALDDAEGALGSRFMERHRVGVPSWRRWGNRFLTGAANLRFGTAMTELHTGARAFRADALRALPLGDFSDDYVFDQQVLVGMMARGMTLAERPLTARYDDTVQSITFRRSVRYGLGCLWVIARAR